MKFRFVLLFVTITFFSCNKKDVKMPDNVPSNTFILRNFSNWRIAADHLEYDFYDSLAGDYQTQSFDLQAPNELRWLSWLKDKSAYTHSMEIVLNINQNILYINDVGFNQNQIKTIYLGNTWETQLPTLGGNKISVSKNNIKILLTTDNNPAFIKKILPSEDGLLNNSELKGDTNTVSHFHYGTEKWKTNTFWATEFIPFRFNNRSYVFSILRGTSQNGMKLYSETNNMVINSTGRLNYPMKEENYYNLYLVGNVIQSTQYGSYVFVALDNVWQNKFEVYKMNLLDFTIQKVVEEPKANTYSHYSNEIDTIGNLYIVENRVDNNSAHYSVRKYKTNGGNEVILNETDLLENARIEALKFFRGKLHIAMVYKEKNESRNKHFIHRFEIISQR